MLEGLEVAPGTIFDCGPRPSPAAIDTFRRVGVSNVASALGGPLAMQRLVDGHAIPRVSGSGVVAGFAVTVWHPPGSNGMLMSAIDLVEPGDVLVVCGPTETAQWGDIATTVAARRGAAGAVVDGAVRDPRTDSGDGLLALGFPRLRRSRVSEGCGLRKCSDRLERPAGTSGRRNCGRFRWYSLHSGSPGGSGP